MQIKKDERNEIKSTSHSRYRRQYHIVFAPKYAYGGSPAAAGVVLNGSGIIPLASVEKTPIL